MGTYFRQAQEAREACFECHLRQKVGKRKHARPESRLPLKATDLTYLGKVGSPLQPSGVP